MYFFLEHFICTLVTKSVNFRQATYGTGRDATYVMELIEWCTMTVQELPQHPHSCPPHLLLLHEPLNALLAVLIVCGWVCEGGHCRLYGRHCHPWVVVRR